MPENMQKERSGSLKILCTVCARGGSKGVKNKNIKELCGKPLIAYTIEQAKESGIFERIVVSTDSDEIASIASLYGGEVFFKRPAELATDSAPKVPVIRHALLESERHFNTKFDIVLDLDPTSPLRSVADIENALEQFLKDDNDNLITAMPSRRSPYFNLVEKINGKIMTAKSLETPVARRQDAPKCYDMNASIYIWKRDILLQNDRIFLENTGLYVMPEERSIDIDSELDFNFVSFMMSGKEKRGLLDGKVVLLIGGAGLLGEQFARAIIEEDGTPVIIEISEEKGRSVKEKIISETGKVNIEALTADMASMEDLQKVIGWTHSKFGRIDALVNTAYPRYGKYGAKFDDVTLDDFCGNVNLHLGGYFLATQQIGEYFKKQGHGNIINICSIYGVIAPKFEIYENTSMTVPVEYAVIKSALVHLARYLAKYYKGRNIRVNSISPGGILDKQPENFLNNYKSKALSKGMLEKTDINGTLIYLLSDMSKYVNGQNIVVDDGFCL